MDNDALIEKAKKEPDKNKHSICKHTATLPDLEAWIADHSSNGISMSTKKTTICEERQWVSLWGHLTATE